MQKGTTLFYYDHINSNIKNVQKRTDTFLNLRIQFLKSCCEPIQAKIQALNKQIQYYKHLIQNQNEMIQNEPDIFRLKQEISQFMNTQNYFQSHLDQYEKRAFLFQQQNQNLTQKIKKIKGQMHTRTNARQTQFYTEMVSSESLQHNSIEEESVKDDKSSKDKKSRISFLPKIFKVDKYFVNKQTALIESVRNNQTNKQTFFKKSMTSPIYQHEPDQNNPAQKDENNPQHMNNMKQQASNKIKEFDTTQTFFKECFEKKKHQIQKFVSQLQSKLITNRQKFLQICLAVNKNEKIDFQHFKQLSGDQIMTLFISFSWLNKAFFDQLVQKRKRIIQIKSKLVNLKF